MAGKIPRVTNDQLGDRLGVSHAMASRLRNGRRLPSIRVLNAIHREFGIPLDALHETHVRCSRDHDATEFGKLLEQALASPSRQAA